MLHALTSFMLGDEYARNRDEVNRQNRLAIHYLAMGGLPVGLVNMAAQAVVRGNPITLAHDNHLLVYFCLVLIIDLLLDGRKFEHSTLLVYLIETPVFVVSILLGSLWDPSHQAITFLMFLIVLPAFVLDRPWRVMSVSILWTALFLGACHIYKTPDTFMPDAIHAIEFLLASLTVSFVVLRLRFEVMGHLSLTRYHLVHDAQTGAYNQEGLSENINRYLGKPLFVVIGNVDHLSLYNEFYGVETGNLILHSFADELKAQFGESHTYRYSGGDLLCVGVGMGENAGTKLLETCRTNLAKLQLDDVNSKITYSFGYAFGTAKDEQTLRDIIQLADIYAHKAGNQGEGTNMGGAFGSSILRDLIAESSLTAHARSYEINQLTGFPSMTYFVNRVEELLSIPGISQNHAVIGFLNVVDFKDFNDRNGYTKGDDLLQTLAMLLREVLPQRHMSYLTGSRFIVFCYRSEVEEAIEKLSLALANYLPDQPVRIRCGFAEYHDGDAVISLIDQAKLAHDHVAPNDPKGYRFYDAELDREIRLRKHLTSHIDRAVDLHWLLVHYQPIMDSRTGKIVNFEALSRWNDPIYGLLPPSQFIGALEDEGLVYKLTRGVIRQVLRDQQSLQKRGLPVVPVSINLSRKDFFACDMVEEITTMVDESGLPRSVIAIEITESAFVRSTAIIKREVARLRELGFAVWMDDFGSEYSSLNLLEELDFDLVKIDMRFMRNFHATSKSATIVAAITGMCNKLGMQTLVEGVEEEEQRDLLCDMGVDKLQGYLFSPPRSLPDLLSLAQAHGWL